MTKKVHDHLYGHRFVVVTDNNPLTYVLTTAKLDAVGHVSNSAEWNGYMSSLPVDSHVASQFRPLPTSDGRTLLNPIIAVKQSSGDVSQLKKEERFKVFVREWKHIKLHEGVLYHCKTPVLSFLHLFMMRLASFYILIWVTWVKTVCHRYLGNDFTVLVYQSL